MHAKAKDIYFLGVEVSICMYVNLKGRHSNRPDFHIKSELNMVGCIGDFIPFQIILLPASMMPLALYLQF